MKDDLPKIIQPKSITAPGNLVGNIILLTHLINQSKQQTHFAFGYQAGINMLRISMLEYGTPNYSG